MWRKPADAPARWRLGIFCVFRRGKSPVDGSFFIPRSGGKIYPRVVVIAVRALLPWATLSLVLVYLSAAALLHARLCRDPFNRASYLDVAAPWNWSDIPRLRGEAMLAQAKDAHDRSQYADALFLLGVGLERIPSDADARVRLASLYALIGRRDLADTTLLNGLNHGAPEPGFISRALPLLRESDRPDQLLAFCVGAAPMAGSDAKTLSALIAARCSALSDLERHSEARLLLEQPSPLSAIDVLRLRVQVELSARNPEAAYAAARAWLHESPRDLEALIALVDLSRQTNRLAEMEEYLRTLREIDPTKPGFAVMAISQNLLANRPAEAETAWEHLVLRFGADIKAMEGLATDLGKIKAFGMLDRVERHFVEHGIDLQNLWFSRLNAQLEQGDWEAARVTLARLADKGKNLSAPLAVFVRTSSAVVEYALTGAPVAKSNIMESLAQSPGRLRLYLMVFDWLARSSRWEGAADVLVLAEGAYPRSRQLEERRLRIAPLLEQSETAKKLTAEQNAARATQSDSYPDAATFVQALDALSDTGDHEAVLRAVNHVRREAPAWLLAAPEQVDRREMLAALALNDLPKIKLTAHHYLREGPVSRRKECCAWAEEAYAKGRESTARLLVNEVLRQDSENADALALLVRWKKDRREENP